MSLGIISFSDLLDLGSIKILSNPNLCTFIVRTWKERLFSFPWNPFKKYRKSIDNHVYKVNDYFIAHPVIVRQIIKARKRFKNEM